MGATVNEIEDVRAILHGVLGDDRLEGVAADIALLKSGLLTSIELVSVSLELERRGARPVLGGGVAPGAISLDTLAAALQGRVEARAADETLTQTPLLQGLRGALRRPWLFALSALAGLLVCDRLVTVAIEQHAAGAYAAFLEGGKRLYPFAGGWSQDDFRFAVDHHAVRTRRSPSQRLTLFLGDSGTIGSFVAPDDSLVAQMEAGLQQRGERVNVANLAWFGRLTAKDLMLLELVWDLPFDTVVFTLGEDHFSRSKVDMWLSRYRHVSVNLPLYEAFLQRIPQAERGPFQALGARLAQTDVRHLGPLRRWGFAHLAAFHYGPFLQRVVQATLAPEWLAAREREAMAQRCTTAGQTGTLADGIDLDDIDAEQIAILRSTIRLLQRRNVRVVLYVEPRGPAEWLRDLATRKQAADIAREIGRDTGATVVDLSRALQGGAFLDTTAHYTAAANRVLGASLASALCPGDSP